MERTFTETLIGRVNRYEALKSKMEKGNLTEREGFEFDCLENEFENTKLIPKHL